MSSGPYALSHQFQLVRLAQPPAALNQIAPEKLLDGQLEEETAPGGIASVKQEMEPPPVPPSQAEPTLRSRLVAAGVHTSTPRSRISRIKGSPSSTRRRSSSGVGTRGETGRPKLRSRMAARALAMRA